jgi:hypothetical protein
MSQGAGRIPVFPSTWICFTVIKYMTVTEALRSVKIQCSNAISEVRISSEFYAYDTRKVNHQC